MASYFRNIFGAQPAPAPGSKPSKSHSRSHSASQKNQNTNYIYTVPGTTPSSTSSRTNRQRSHSHAPAQTTASSPLRYATYNSAVVHAAQHHQSQPLYRPASHQTGDRPALYPLYTPSVSFSSSRSGSSSSVHPVIPTSSHPGPPRTSSSGSVGYKDARPPLKQNHTWHAGANGSHSSSFPQVPQRQSLNMHPLFACSRLHSCPITYDVSYAPSSRTVLDRAKAAVPPHTLSQPATDPTTLNRLVLRSDKFPWTVVVSPSGAKSSARFYIASSSSKSDAIVTNLDVLHALYNTLSARVTQAEWESLGYGSRAQSKVTRAYEKRCIKMGGGWEGGVRRIDWLHGKTRLFGIEVDKSAGGGGTGKIIFGKA